MRWIPVIVVSIMFSGCTIKVEPLPKQSAKQQHHSTSHRNHPRPSPTPMPDIHRPMQLEPTDRPTPIIHIDPQAVVTPMDLSEALS